MRKSTLSGKIWVLLDKQNRLIEDIDTDQIYHNAYLYITELSHMGQYALGNLEGWQDFPDIARPGDIIISGRNFGAGSSRQQAVDCFMALKLGMIIAPSFGAIYFRNAVNSGFPVLTCPRLAELVSEKVFETGDEVSIDLQAGQGHNPRKKKTFFLDPLSPVQFGIWEAGGLFPYAKKMKKD